MPGVQDGLGHRRHADVPVRLRGRRREGQRPDRHHEALQEPGPDPGCYYYTMIYYTIIYYITIYYIIYYITYYLQASDTSDQLDLATGFRDPRAQDSQGKLYMI